MEQTSSIVSLDFEPSRVFVDSAQSVLFFARQGEKVVRCYVTAKALVTYFGASDDPGEDDDCLLAFDAHRAAIQQVARHMIDDRGRLVNRAIVITASDVYRDLVQGFLATPAVSRGAAGHA